MLPIETLEEVCLSCPCATEDVKWENNLCFLIGDKIFCIVNLEPPHSFSCRVNPADFDEMTSREGFSQAPYFAKKRWVRVDNPGRLTRTELKKLLSGSYELVKAGLTVKKRHELGLD
jgi:predicted DNA-binding protein (MmcQ/YjbR family)